MNDTWKEIINKNILSKKKINQYRTLKSINIINDKYIQINGKKLINFASNDYLGLVSDPRVINAGNEYAKQWGAGSGASRLITGTLQPFTDLEKRFAEWMRKERALIFNSGYQANVGIISAFADKNTVIFTDKLNHASIYDGILMTNAKLVRYPHCNEFKLEELLKKYRDISRKIIITDSVFSMGGDICPICQIIELAKEYGALTIVDEAHSIGIHSEDGSGLVSECNYNNDIDIIMGTLGKSFGVFGAFIAASNEVVEYLINNCRSFIFTTALPPFVIGAVNEALNIIIKEERGRKTFDKAIMFSTILKSNKINIGNTCSQIVPVIVDTNEKALDLMNFLMKNGFYTPAVRPPAVPVNTSRVRISISYRHEKKDIKRLTGLILDWCKRNLI